ncbi:hypothetical protein EDB89DRAFT_285517 [Lactarius sanguifluus]|nr:hypothetical protein EDB89DRAFT_285517 [Lactarius sanguifluus]
MFDPVTGLARGRGPGPGPIKVFSLCLLRSSTAATLRIPALRVSSLACLSSSAFSSSAFFCSWQREYLGDSCRQGGNVQGGTEEKRNQRGGRQRGLFTVVSRY